MESKFKGTKGNWGLGEIKISVWGEERKGCIADCTGVHKEDFYFGFSEDEMKANALLISKAPEMLEMLIRCEHWTASCNENANIVKDIQKLIKEATEL